jgi:hypothetical protein
VRAIKARVSSLLAVKGMFVLDAFRAFDGDRDGQLCCSELYGGLDWLGLTDLQPEQVHDLVRRIDSNGDGLVSMADFKLAFHRAGEATEGGATAATALLESGGGGPGGSDGAKYSLGSPTAMGAVTVPPKRIAELHLAGKPNAGGADGAGEKPMDVVMKDIKGIKVKTQVQASFAAIWDSRAIGTRTNVSVWHPGEHTSLLQRNRDRVCLGHYAVAGLKDPSKDKALKNGVISVEVTDTAVTRFGSVGASSPHLQAVIDRLLPFPVRFKQVWNTLGKRTESHMYAWQAVPPSADFVCLGMVATSDEDQPELRSVRCVPLRWCKPASFEPKLLWDDAGTGGKRGSIWLVNAMGMMAVARGTDAPKDQFFELKEERFFLDSEDLAVLRHEDKGHSTHGGGADDGQDDTGAL